MNWFDFNQKKATQAAIFLLRKSNGKMNYMKMIKLLYLLDRKALEKWERPISGDKYCSMDNGTVVSEILNLIKLDEEKQKNTYWHQFIKRNKYNIELVQETEIDELSKREVKIIDEIFENFGSMDEWELREYTHKLPEWEDPKGSMIPIRVSNLMKIIGKNEEEIKEFEDEVNNNKYAKALLTKC